ncbi:MAG: YHS domain-containing protein [Capsulimonadaceae bacterium]|nr:YHS domain-containing protein [Capsulimonadaceae bacterium]
MKIRSNMLIVGIVLALATTMAFADKATTSTSSTSTVAPAAKSGCGMMGAGGMEGCKTKKAKAIAAAKKNKAHLVKCAVTGEIIGSAADASGSAVYKGHIYYFCCAGCEPKFKANPAKFAKPDCAYAIPGKTAPSKPAKAL